MCHYYRWYNIYNIIIIISPLFVFRPLRRRRIRMPLLSRRYHRRPTERVRI